MMQMMGAPMTGNKAVRFLFFPIFNALWSFVAIYGWSRLWNHNVRNHPGLSLAKPVWRPFFFIFPILFLLSQTVLITHLVTGDWPTNPTNPQHLASLVILATTLIFTALTFFQISQSINFLTTKKS